MGTRAEQINGLNGGLELSSPLYNIPLSLVVLLNSNVRLLSARGECFLLLNRLD